MTNNRTLFKPNILYFSKRWKNKIYNNFSVIQWHNCSRFSEQASEVEFAVHYKGKEISNGSSYKSLPRLVILAIILSVNNCTSSTSPPAPTTPHYHRSPGLLGWWGDITYALATEIKVKIIPNAPKYGKFVHNSPEVSCCKRKWRLHFVQSSYWPLWRVWWRMGFFFNVFLFPWPVSFWCIYIYIYIYKKIKKKLYTNNNRIFFTGTY